MIAIHVNKVKGVQSYFDKSIKTHRENAIKNLEKIVATGDERGYLNSVIDLFNANEDILTWEPSKLKEKADKFDPVPTFFDKDGNERTCGIKNKIIEKLGYKSKRKSFYPKYFGRIGIKACVYCNSVLTISASKSTGKGLHAKFDVDHYLSKDEYPFLSICLFNLYPACAPCNRLKSNNDYIEFKLYSDDNKDVNHSGYRFRFDKSTKAQYLLTKDPEVLDFEFEEPDYSAGKKTFQEVFHIKGIYETQKDTIEELIAKSQIYNESYVKLLKDSFSKLQLNPELFKRTLIGAYTKDKDIHKRPLNKFIMDIAKDLGVID